MINELKKAGLLIVLFIVFAFFTGCEQKTEKQVDNPPTIDKPTEQKQPAVDTTKPAEPAAPAVKVEGTWKGTFWNKSMTLTIAKQTGNEFEGETSVKWAKALVSKVKGTIDPKALTMTFEDVVDNKDAGKYEGTLSADMKSFTGKFILKQNPKTTYDVKLKLQ